MIKMPPKMLLMLIVGLFLISFLFRNSSLVALAYNQTENELTTDSDILTDVRLSQMSQYFEGFERMELGQIQDRIGLQTEEVVPCTPASANPVSVCVASACTGSVCIGSGCGVSYCLGSACAGSLCGGSGCGVSNCGGSACAVSICGGSACGASVCAGSLCFGCRR